MLILSILKKFAQLKQQGCVPFAKPLRSKPVNQKLNITYDFKTNFMITFIYWKVFGCRKSFGSNEKCIKGCSTTSNGIKIRGTVVNPTSRWVCNYQYFSVW